MSKLFQGYCSLASAPPPVSGGALMKEVKLMTAIPSSRAPRYPGDRSRADRSRADRSGAARLLTTVASVLAAAMAMKSAW